MPVVSIPARHNPKQTISPSLAADFRDAMRQLPGGISVITAGLGEDRSGMTVTSVSSLTTDPPTLIVCVNKKSSTWGLLNRYGVFGVNILAARHQFIAERFSGKEGVRGLARYADAKWGVLSTGVWLLADAPAVIDCRVEEFIDRYSHSIVVGRAEATRSSKGDYALASWRGHYFGHSNGSLSLNWFD